MNRKILLPAALLLGTAGQAFAGMAGPMPMTGLVGKYKKPGFEFCTNDKFKTNCLTIGGSLQVDYNYFDVGTVNNAAAGGGLLGDGADVRRARIHVEGHLTHDWHYKVEASFSRPQRLRDAFVRYTGFDNLFFTVGQFRPSVGQQRDTETTNLEFLEWSQNVQAFTPDRRLAAQANYYNDWMMANVGVFGSDYRPAVNGDVNVGGGNQPFGWNARVNVSPWNEMGKVVSMGASYWSQKAYANTTVNSQVNYRLQTNPGLEAWQAGYLTRYQGTTVDSVNVWTVEGAAIYGSFDLSGAYNWTTVKQTAGNNDLDFSGYYVQGGYFVTGEMRQWCSKFAKWKDKTSNNNEWGAVQVALRYDSVDMTDTARASFNGRQDNLTVGVNYYPTDVVRFGLNYIHGKFKPGQGNADTKINMVGLRAQVVI